MQQRRTPSGPGARGGRPTGARAGGRAEPARGRSDAGRARTGRDAAGAGRTTTRTPGRGLPARPAATPRPAGSGRGVDTGRSPGRPAARRGGAGGGAAKRIRAPQPRRLTGRATVLAGVLIVLLFAYAYPVRIYLSQQAEIAELEQQQAEQRRRIESLAERREKWNDPEYVRAQARSRLQYVLPGEVPLVVLHDKAAGTPGGDPAAGRAAAPPWYGQLWSSVREADRR